MYARESHSGRLLNHTDLLRKGNCQATIEFSLELRLVRMVPSEMGEVELD